MSSQINGRQNARNDGTKIRRRGGGGERGGERGGKREEEKGREEEIRRENGGGGETEGKTEPEGVVFLFTRKSKT